MYQICQRCVMDVTASEITFDEKGICNFCHEFENTKALIWKRGDEGRDLLNKTLEMIKLNSKGKEYDCIVGLSGGVDSSFVAYLAKKDFGLRPLVVHVDTGWNSELAVKNIENIVKKLNVDLYTHVIDWEEMQDLQLAFFKSGIVCQDNPQDHVFHSVLRKIAKEKKVTYFITGSNVSTECILPRSWGYNNLDSKLIKSVHKKFGTIKLKTYPFVSFFKYYFVYPFFHRIKRVDVLNLIEYDKEKAMKVLQDKLDWKYYGGKHHESVFTKFFQTYYQPKRFGFEKRRAHLASLVVTNQMSRDAAIELLSKEPYSEKELKEDSLYIAKKLGITMDEFDNYMNTPSTTEKDFPNNSLFFNIVKQVLKSK